MRSMDVRLDRRQQQTLSPRLQHAVRLLQLSSLDFAQAVQQALGRNPFLEAQEGEDLEHQDVEPMAVSQPEAPAGAADDALGAESDREIWQTPGLTNNTRRGEGEDLSALDRVAMQSSLAEHLHGQLTSQPLPQRDRLLAHVIVESLDDDGYLRTPLEDLLSLADLTPPATLAEMELALQRVQSLEPAGVGARSVAECLRLQLPAIECPVMNELAEAIIENHLPLLAARDVTGLARALDRTPAQIEQVCDRIRHLDPRPGWRVGASETQYVIPDVIVRKVRGAWTVQLNSAIVPKVKLNQVYADLFRRAKPEQHPELAGQLQEARWTVRNVEQRFSTIVSVAEAIVRRQKHFLDFGSMAMKPLGLKEIAEELGIHESTVSRVTNNKYMATPLGVFELKHFFSRALVTTNGRACSGTAIRGLISDMLAAERPSTPLSDAEIARQLARQGLTVARRTVTKYRQALRIESVERRRRRA